MADERLEFTWIRDARDEEYYVLKNFEQLVVTQVWNYSEELPSQHWEAIVFENDSCQRVLARQEFPTKEEAQAAQERLVILALKNREAAG